MKTYYISKLAIFSAVAPKGLSFLLPFQGCITQIVVPNNYELQISNNICPKCGWYLTKRINGQTGEEFRGCSNFAYHDCKFTISNDEYIRIYKKFH